MIPALIAARAQRTPEATAILLGGEPTTYRDLDRRARRLAAQLRSLRLGRDAVVGVHAERSVELVVGVLGTLYAGAAFLPLEPGCPPRRLRAMLADAGTPPVVTTAALAGTLPGTPVLLDDLPEAQLHELPPADGDDLAYVLFTSGTSGRPKGVLSTHGGLLNRLAWMNDAFALTPEDRVLHKTPIGFDVAVWELLWPLAFGAPLVLARPDGHWQFAYLADEIVASRVTLVHFVPSLLRRFLRTPGVERCTSLRAIVCSGEALTAQLRDACLAALPAQLHNLYGPTEASIDVTHWHCQRGERQRSVPIGHPIANMRVHVLDEALEPVADGGAGELCLAGVGLARGYLGRPDLTAERFVTIRPGGRDAERVYRSGDLGRRRRDGALEYLGRLDRQIKLEGVRIEPAEIEALLDAQPGVRASVVRLHDGRLIAYVESELDAHDVQQLRRSLAERLPAAMVPAAVVAVRELPLTANGKLNDAGLAAAAAPSGAMLQEIVMSLWCELLLVKRVAPDARFFDVGGHSLLLVELHRRLEDRLELRFAPAELLRHATPAEQARFLATLVTPA